MTIQIQNSKFELQDSRFNQLAAALSCLVRLGQNQIPQP
jgi:hypothetical protein